MILAMPAALGAASAALADPSQPTPGPTATAGPIQLNPAPVVPPIRYAKLSVQVDHILITTTENGTSATATNVCRGQLAVPVYDWRLPSSATFSPEAYSCDVDTQLGKATVHANGLITFNRSSVPSADPNEPVVDMKTFNLSAWIDTPQANGSHNTFISDGAQAETPDLATGRMILRVPGLPVGSTNGSAKTGTFQEQFAVSASFEDSSDVPPSPSPSK
jgi:hypothetical protein